MAQPVEVKLLGEPLRAWRETATLRPVDTVSCAVRS